MLGQVIVNDILLANPDRSEADIHRRLIKVMEELGEASEAYLSRTSEANYKNKSWGDYREESIDTMIVLVDIALTPLLDDNYPAASLLPNMINDGFAKRITSFAEMEDRKFAILKNVALCRKGLKSQSYMGFYGAINKSIRAAADMVYADIPGDTTSNIEETVYRVLKIKLDKWTSRVANKTVETVG